MMRKAVSAIFGVALLGMTAGISTEASAGAVGCAFMPAFKVTKDGVPIPIPGGNLCHRIDGDKKFISFQKAAFNKNIGAPGLVCNWKIDFIYKDNDGRIYLRDRGRIHDKCNLQAVRSVQADKNLRHYGSSCAQLIIDGDVKVQQCHRITKGFSIF